MTTDKQLIQALEDASTVLNGVAHRTTNTDVGAYLNAVSVGFDILGEALSEGQEFNTDKKIEGLIEILKAVGEA